MSLIYCKPKYQDSFQEFLNSEFPGFKILSPIAKSAAWYPALDISEDKDNIVVKADLPGLKKEEIRNLSRELGLAIWDKPASPCLSSRLPYGSEITPEKLRQVEAGENFLKDLGFKVVRMRHFGTKARVELGREEFVETMDVGLRSKITEFITSKIFYVRSITSIGGRFNLAFTF